MLRRDLWLARLQEAWRSSSLCWLSGVRGVGKASLCEALPGATHLPCDRPESLARLAEPAAFLRTLGAGPLILHDAQLLPDLAALLQLAAADFPELRVVATSPSGAAFAGPLGPGLAASASPVTLVPVLAAELEAFGVDVDRRLLHGGLPDALLRPALDGRFYAAWLEAFAALDVPSHLRVGRRRGFLTLLETLLRQSGGLVEVTAMARASGLSRPTVMTYLDLLEAKGVITRLRPFSGGVSARELVHAPKAYAFDTGFVCHARGITALRPDDRAGLLEHLTLEALQSLAEVPRVHYWRDKGRHEVAFVLPLRRDRIDAIEVRGSLDTFDAGSLRAFRGLHPRGRSWLVTARGGPPCDRSAAGLALTCLGIEHLRDALQASLRAR